MQRVMTVHTTEQQPFAGICSLLNPFASAEGEALAGEWGVPINSPSFPPQAASQREL